MNFPRHLPRASRFCAALLGLAVLTAPTWADDSAHGKKPPVSKSRAELKSEAAGLALATSTVESISEDQLRTAERVMIGHADCEFGQTVSVVAVEGQPGHFHVGYKGRTYTMTPEQTTTGAVRLFDRRAGVMWLQIPVKSMLFNQRAGQRMVDNCMQPQQRTAAAEPQPSLTK